MSLKACVRFFSRAKLGGFLGRETLLKTDKARRKKNTVRKCRHKKIDQQKNREYCPAREQKNSSGQKKTMFIFAACCCLPVGTISGTFFALPLFAHSFLSDESSHRV